MKKIVVLILICCLAGCEEILYEEDITTKSVSLLAPTNGVSLVTGDVIFNWQTVNGATDYELQVATPSFENAEQIVLDTIVSGVSFTQLLEANIYEWRLKALNSAYETNYTKSDFEVVLEP